MLELYYQMDLSSIAAVVAIHEAFIKLMRGQNIEPEQQGSRPQCTFRQQREQQQQQQLEWGQARSGCRPGEIEEVHAMVLHANEAA